jgi:hypothetical protein
VPDQVAQPLIGQSQPDDEVNHEDPQVIQLKPSAQVQQPIR